MKPETNDKLLAAIDQAVQETRDVEIVREATDSFLQWWDDELTARREQGVD